MKQWKGKSAAVIPLGAHGAKESERVWSNEIGRRGIREKTGRALTRRPSHLKQNMQDLRLHTCKVRNSGGLISTC